MQGKFDKKLLVFLIIAFELTILDIVTRILVIVSHELMAKRDSISPSIITQYDESTVVQISAVF